MQPWKRALAVAVAGGFLTACASSYSDVRETEPIRVQIVKGDPSRLADCLIDKLQLRHGSNPDLTWHKSQVRATVHLSQTMADVGYTWDLALTPVSNGTRAELRAAKSLWGPMSSTELWKMIAACGAYS